MPTINRLPKAKRLTENTESREKRQKYYQTSRWQKLRLIKLANDPLCEICLNEKKDRITAADSVHHLVSPFSKNLTEDETKALFYDEKNLLSICAVCHGELHSNQQHHQ